jgi:hypothetical protein
MKPASRINSRIFATSVFIASLLLATAARSDVVFDWNAKADAIGAEKQVPNALHARVMAMLHVAMFEAVNAIERRYSAYQLNLAADRATSKEAAAASAAYSVLLAVHPDQKKDLDALLASSLAGIAESETKSNGIELGKKAAVGILALRENDGSNAPEKYRPHGQPGVYVPTILPIESTSGGIKPWVMKTGSQFRPAPPPALTSEIWTKDLNEIRELGSRNSTRRTAEQTEIGRFWFFTGSRTFNPIVRQIVSARGMDITDNTRLFALTAMASADSFIAVFDAKYAYNLWRPITAIRNADLTSNPATPRDETWAPLGTTPMHPEYPCAHCITSAAVSTVLQNVVGNEIAEVSLTSPTAPGVTRKWTRLGDYSDEVAVSRIYAGFHYRFSTEAGKDMGKKIGELTATTQLLGVAASAQAKR